MKRPSTPRVELWWVVHELDPDPVVVLDERRVVPAAEARIRLRFPDGSPARADCDSVQAVDLGGIVDCKGEVLPADTAVPMWPSAGLPRGEQDELDFARARPSDRPLRVASFQPERLQHRVELRDGARKVFDGRTQMIESDIPT
jgi:hypothetical protein